MRKPVVNSSTSQASDFAVEDYLLYLLARASHQASRQFHLTVKQHGLNVPQWRVLASLGAGPLNISALARRTLYQQPTLTKVVDRMCEEGLTRRYRKPDDGRVVLVESTEQGKKLAAKLQVRARDHEDTILSGYGVGEAAQLKSALKTLIARTAADEVADF